jgi:hypothetical protein
VYGQERCGCCPQGNDNELVVAYVTTESLRFERGLIFIKA